jgi:hypothetical protein
LQAVTHGKALSDGLDLETGRFQKEPLPAKAFAPLDVNKSKKTALFATRQGGAAIYDMNGSTTTIAAVDLPFHAMGGVIDLQGPRVVLGGNGLVGWNTETGRLSRLCERGSCPAIDASGGLWFSLTDGALARLQDGAIGFDVIVELSGLDTSHDESGSFAQPVTFSPDGRYGLAVLTGKTELTGKDLEEAEAFCKRVGQPFAKFHRHRYHHYFCILDLNRQEVWCHEGYAHNVAWITRQDMS